MIVCLRKYCAGSASGPAFLRGGAPASRGIGRSPFRLRRNTRASLVSPACGGRGCAPHCLPSIKSSPGEPSLKILRGALFDFTPVPPAAAHTCRRFRSGFRSSFLPFCSAGRRNAKTPAAWQGYSPVFRRSSAPASKPSAPPPPFAAAGTPAPAPVDRGQHQGS